MLYAKNLTIIGNVNGITKFENCLYTRERTVLVRMQETLHRYVEIDPTKYDGKPVIAGTRVPVLALVTHYRSGMPLEEILEGYPNINSAQLFDALSYYFDNKEAIDAELQ